MRECPASDGCLARESSSRRLRRGSAAARHRHQQHTKARFRSLISPYPTSTQAYYTTMTIQELFSRLVLQEDLNFLLTNRVPRQLLTRFMGWFSQIEQPLVRDLPSPSGNSLPISTSARPKNENSAACMTVSPASSNTAPELLTATPGA